MFHKGLSLPAAVLAGIVALLSAASVYAQARDPQIEALIAHMTIEEKAGQLTILADEPRTCRRRESGIQSPQGRRTAAEVRAGRVGALMNGHGAARGAPRNASRSRNRD